MLFVLNRLILCKTIQPDRPKTANAVDVNRLIKETIQLRVFGSGGLAGGSYPISFRTRQSSLLAAMVLIVTDGESS